MALNIQTLKTRAITAVIFVAVMLFGLLYNYWSFFILFSIIHFGCWVEYQKLIGLIDDDYYNITYFHKYAIMLCGYGFMLSNIHEKLQPFGLPIAEIGKWIVIVIAVILPIKEIVLSKKNNVKVLGFSVLGLAYISLAWGLMMSIRNKGLSFKGNFLMMDFGDIPIIFIASIWINDTMAYIVGSLIGKTPLTKISPKKTWEGTIGGAILAVAVVTTLWYFLIGENTIFIAIGTAVIAAIVGTLGDLLESKLKRMANVKDSGSFMPGHGGFLDRFDSLILATPFVWLFLQLLFR
jgi:phosphatidate cytidylyltransferase